MPARSAGERLRRIGQRPRRSRNGDARIDNLIVIGGSAGAISALTTIFETVPPDIPAAIVVVLHQTRDSAYRLAASFERKTRIPVVPVERDAPLRQGSIYVPSPGMSLAFRRGRIAESESNDPSHSVATINRMFASAAREYGGRVIGVVLSGLLKDGTDGLRAVHEAGGLTIVQDPAEAEHGDMPSSASKDLPVTLSLSLSDVGLALDLLARRTRSLETGFAVSVRLLKKRVDLLLRLKSRSGRHGEVARFLDEELTSLRRDLRSITRLLNRASLEALRLHSPGGRPRR